MPSGVALDPGVEGDADRLSAGPDPGVREDADRLPAGAVADSGVGGGADWPPGGMLGAWGLPDTASEGVGDVRGGGAGRPAARRRAALAAYGARQARAPQEQGGPAGWTGMWPSSPARPRAPVKRRPPTTRAAPMPLSAETWMKSAATGCAHSSASAPR